MSRGTGSLRPLNRHARPDSAPARQSLGLAACTAIVVGNMVGSGFYLSPSAVAPYGLLAIVAWIVMGVGAMCLGLTFARLARLMPATGGPYAYTQAGLRRLRRLPRRRGATGFRSGRRCR